MSMKDGDNYLYKVKVLNLGNGAVGKTSLALRYTHNKFNEKYITSLGVDLFSKEINLFEEMTIKLSVFDTISQKNFAPLRKRYYPGSNGAIIIYDITNRQSFESVDYWIEEVKENVSDIEIIIVGNKIDLYEEREVTYEEAVKKYGDRYSVFETSAKLGKGVEDVYTTITKRIVEKITN